MRLQTRATMIGSEMVDKHSYWRCIHLSLSSCLHLFTFSMVYAAGKNIDFEPMDISVIIWSIFPGTRLRLYTTTKTLNGCALKPSLEALDDIFRGVILAPNRGG